MGRLNSVSSEVDPVVVESKLVPLVPLGLLVPLTELVTFVVVVTLLVSNDKFLTIFELLFGDNFLLSSVDASFDKNDNAEFC